MQYYIFIIVVMLSMIGCNDEIVLTENQTDISVNDSNDSITGKYIVNDSCNVEYQFKYINTDWMIEFDIKNGKDRWKPVYQFHQKDSLVIIKHGFTACEDSILTFEVCQYVEDNPLFEGFLEDKKLFLDIKLHKIKEALAVDM